MAMKSRSSQHPSFHSYDDALVRKSSLTFNQQTVKEKDTSPDITSSAQFYLFSSEEECSSTDVEEEEEEVVDDDDDDFADEEDKLFKKGKPPLTTWIGYWRETENRETESKMNDWISVYGFFDEKNGYGGYGVVLRDMWAQPIIAATCFTHDGRSKLFQVLNGLKTGLQLAVKRQYPRVGVVCNVEKAVELLGPTTFQNVGDIVPFIHSDSHVMSNGICKECTKSGVFIKTATLESLIPIIADLKKLQAKVDDSTFRFYQSTRRGNPAAHYLAKMAKAKGEAQEVNEYTRIEPVEFENSFKNILYNDAFGLNTQYSRTVFFLTKNSNRNGS